MNQLLNIALFLRITLNIPLFSLMFICIPTDIVEGWGKERGEEKEKIALSKTKDS